MAKFEAIDVVKISEDEQGKIIEELISGDVFLVLGVDEDSGWLLSKVMGSNGEATLKTVMDVNEQELENIMDTDIGQEVVISKKILNKSWNNKIKRIG